MIESSSFKYFENCWKFAAILGKNFYQPPNYVTPKSSMGDKNKNNEYHFKSFTLSVGIYVCCSCKYCATID